MVCSGGVWGPCQALRLVDMHIWPSSLICQVWGKELLVTHGLTHCALLSSW